MTNMSQAQAKIRQKQLIERFKHLKISDLSVVSMNFEYVNVFMKKYEKSEKFKKSDNPFIINIETDKTENPNISDH